MPDCRLCPRQCGADRAVSAGVCHMGSAVRVARAAPHYGEEPCISGERGSGAVFFAGCPLGCVYCQNYALSRGRIGETVSVERLAAIFAGLEAKGVHNLNLVTGTQFTLEIREALAIAKPKIPVVWNTSGYETVETVDALAESVSVVRCRRFCRFRVRPGARRALFPRAGLSGGGKNGHKAYGRAHGLV